LERSGTVSSVDPGTEDEGVVVVEGDGWLDVDGSLPGAPAVGVLDRQPTKGSTRSR
jgi:hypothetical protein